jgi:crotonobetainyl-CoA:carnitine CoA-transferase CaiB-like acyl-CoA transferase
MVLRSRVMSDPGELNDVVVVDLSTDLGGAYCSKLFTDGGATVTRVEPTAGDPFRHWQWSGEPTEGDGPLFRYLRHGQRSVAADSATAEVEALLSGADLVLTNGDSLAGDARELAARLPGTVVVSITPYGLEGPFAGRPANEFTVQADSGSLTPRGTPEMAPFQLGGRIVEWVAGAYAGVGAMAAVRRARSVGVGELVDVALCDVANLTAGNYADLFQSLAGRPELDPDTPYRTVEIPSIEPTLDGWVGFNTNTRDQWDSFCILIERPDLLETAEFASLATRIARRDEWNALVREWTTRHTTADIVEQAALLRIPVAPVSSGRDVLELDHPRVRGVWITDPTGSFEMPRRPYRFDGEPVPTPRPAPAVGEHDGQAAPVRRPRPEAPTGRAPLPLEGVTVLDLTAWWAGPSGAAIFASLGADVVHVESTRRIDGMRTAGGMFFSRPQWWEYSAFFLSANVNKYDVTLTLDTPQGRELAIELVKKADIVIENFTPRVIEAFDLDWPVVHEANPRAIMVRMPAFGLDGPWRDRPGFAQTMEQITGLAWVTGHPDDQPRIQRGPCDPNGGLHAVFSALVALERRDRTGEGCFVEAPMFEAAMNVGAEPAIEWSANGVMVERMGNRSPSAAPQNLFATDRPEHWLAVSCSTDEQWRSLASVIGRPELADEPALATLAGRRAAADRIDPLIAEWAAGRELHAAVAELLAAGVPAAPGTDARRASFNEQMAARGYFETVEHPVVGTHPVPVLPFRYASVERWARRPAPTLGQHNVEILGGWLGHSDDELAALEAEGVTGTWPEGA